jgi:1-acyl-sn-glycerol-3-phosphate acyltransferase
MLPRLGPHVPRRRNIALAWAGGAVLRLMRFRVEGEVPDLAKFVIAVAPHTSNWDFVVGAAVMFALELRAPSSPSTRCFAARSAR